MAIVAVIIKCEECGKEQQFKAVVERGSVETDYDAAESEGWSLDMVDGEEAHLCGECLSK